MTNRRKKQSEPGCFLFALLVVIGFFGSLWLGCYNTTIAVIFLSAALLGALAVTVILAWEAEKEAPGSAPPRNSGMTDSVKKLSKGAAQLIWYGIMVHTLLSLFSRKE